MINANELRLGNWVQVLGVYKDSFLKAGIVQVDAELILLVEQSKVGLLPIPLTPEILEKCGFENRSETSDYCFQLGGFLIGGSMKRYFPSVWGESGLESFGNELKSLHQLQNLYFDLTGEELEVKECST